MNTDLTLPAPRKGNPQAAPIRLGIAAILLALLAFALWAAVAPLSGAVVALGLVKAETNRKSVQHQEGGIVKAILVKDGELVQAGQPLIEMENVGTDADHQLLRELIVFETLKRDRLDAEQQMQSGYDLPPTIVQTYGEELAQAAYQRELRIFRARRTSLNEQLATLAEQIQAIEHERKSLRAEIDAAHESIRLVREELAINQSMERRQYVPKTRVMTLERGLSDYQAKLAENEASLAQSAQRTNDVRLRMASVKNEYQRMAAEEYKESSNRLAELRQRFRPVEDSLRRKIVTAPVSGRVVGLGIHAPGEVAGPRDVLLEIVPDAEDLVIEAQVSVDDIKDLHPGQAADLRFTAYKSRTTPIVTGKLSYVSADVLTDKNGMPFYVVQLRPDAQSLRDAEIVVQPGMAAEVYILTEGRSVIDYLLAPITDTVRRSLRER